MKLNELVETKSEVVEVCGIPFKLREFNNRTRAVWLEEVERFNLADLQRKLQTETLPDVASQAKLIEQDPHIQSLNKRFIKLQKKHEKLLEQYGEDDEPEDIDDQIESVMERMKALSDELEEVGAPKTQNAIDVTVEGQQMITEFMNVQDEARLHFAWRLAQAMGKTDLDFEAFEAQAGPDDYDAVEQLVNAGNAGWVARMQNRASRRATPKNRIGTSSTAKLSQQESPLSNLAN